MSERDHATSAFGLPAADPAVLRYASVGRCVDGVTHDINNYLGAAQAYAELVSLDAGIRDESRRMLGEVVASIGRCAQLVSTMTALARHQRAGMNIVEPEPLVREIAALFQYTCRVRKVAFRTEAEAGLPSILADPQALQLSLVHLMWHVLDGIGESEQQELALVVRQTTLHVEFVLTIGPQNGGTGAAGGDNGLVGLARGLVVEQRGELKQDCPGEFVVCFPKGA